MSHGLVEKDRDDEVKLGRGSAVSISMQQFQHIYGMITGKSEEVSKTSDKPILLEKEDLYQLDQCMSQVLEQFNVVGRSSSYTVFYEGGQKEVFSSYERFAFQASAAAAVTESIYFNYNFSIVLPQVKEAQSYSVSVRVINRVALRKKILEDLPIGIPVRLVNYFSAKTIEFKVEYVDFAVSRSVMAALEAWHESLNESQESFLLKKARSISQYIPAFLQYVGLSFLSFGLLEMFPSVLGEVDELSEFSRIFLISGLLIFVAWRGLGCLGRWVENSVESTVEISYIQLTRGDEREIGKVSGDNRRDLLKACVGGVVSGLSSFLVKYLVLLVR